MDNVVFFIFLAIPLTIKGNMYKGYLGCFEDSKKNRVLNSLKEQRIKNGPKLCSNFCIKKGYRYAGTQYSIHCLCGNEIRYKNESNECNKPCWNNANEICGGTLKLSLYDTWICATEKPCNNNGYCLNVDKDTYNCTCTEQWTGLNCSQVKTTTSSSPTTATTATTQISTTVQPLVSTDTDDVFNDSRNKTETTTDLIEGLDEDNGSSINLMYIMIPCCAVVVLIAFIIGVIIYYRRKKSRGNTNNEIELQKHEGSKQTANDEDEYNTIDDENAASNHNQLDDPTTEGDYMDIDDQAAAASVVEDDEYNILSLKGTHVGPVKKGLNTGQGTISNNTYSHLHELYPSTDDTYSHTNSNYPNKISNTQDNIYDHTSQGMIQASKMELDNTYNILILQNTKGMKQTSAADHSVHRKDDVNLYNSVEEPVLKQANIDVDDYSHLADFDINKQKGKDSQLNNA